MSLNRGTVNSIFFPSFFFFSPLTASGYFCLLILVCNTKLMRYSIVNCDCLCGLAKDASSLCCVLSFCWAGFVLITFSLCWGGFVLGRSRTARQELRVGHTDIAGEMLHETYINKLGWSFAGSWDTLSSGVLPGFLEWSLSARGLETTDLCNAWRCKCWHCPSRQGLYCR